MEIPLQAILNAFPKIRGARLSTSTTFSQSVVIPFATYSPWLDDPVFIQAYKAIAGHSLVDMYRCYELWRLVAQLARCQGDILEVGVWRGGTGCLMARCAQSTAATKHVFLCDTFDGVVKAGPQDSTYRGGEHSDTSAEVVIGLATRLALNNTTIIRGVFPDETAHLLADRRFCLCHIDVDVYASARDVTDWVWPRLSVGGCIVYDDYGFARCDGVATLVNEAALRSGALMLHNLNGHAVLVKTMQAGPA